MYILHSAKPYCHEMPLFLWKYKGANLTGTDGVIPLHILFP